VTHYPKVGVFDFACLSHTCVSHKFARRLRTDFVTYNPNVGLFCFIKFTFEFLPTGEVRTVFAANTMKGKLYQVLQCVVVCCWVLQSVAECRSVLQCVAMCCSVLQCVWKTPLCVCCEHYEGHPVSDCSSLLQCASSCCNVYGEILQCVAVCCSLCCCAWGTPFCVCCGHYELQSVSGIAVCCSVLQCVAVCLLRTLSTTICIRRCSVLQCGAVCCSVLQCLLSCDAVSQCVDACGNVFCSGLQWIAVGLQVCSVFGKLCSFLLQAAGRATCTRRCSVL
jgi:hypothetical protein